MQFYQAVKQASLDDFLHSETRYRASLVSDALCVLLTTCLCVFAVRMFEHGRVTAVPHDPRYPIVEDAGFEDSGQ